MVDVEETSCLLENIFDNALILPPPRCSLIHKSYIEKEIDKFRPVLTYFPHIYKKGYYFMAQMGSWRGSDSEQYHGLLCSSHYWKTIRV